jgi:hypothetical protein
MQLTLTTQYKITKTASDKFRLQVWVSEAVGLNPEIFLVRNTLAMPTLPASPTFIRVCSYSDTVNYGTAADAYRQHYRVKSLDMTYTVKQELDTALAAINAGVATLKTDVQTLMDATPVVTTDTINWLTLSKSYLSGSGVSKQATLTLSTADGSKDPYLFLVSKSSSAAAINTAELIAVASPEDLGEYSTVEIYPGLYRTNRVDFVFPSAAIRDAVVTSIKADLTDTAGSLVSVVADTGTLALTATMGDSNTLIKG